MDLRRRCQHILTVLRERGPQSIRKLAQATGLPKSSVDRHCKGLREHARQVPEAELWEHEQSAQWLRVLAVLLVFGLKGGVGVERFAEFFHRIRLERYLAVSLSALRLLRTQMEEVILAYQATQEQQIGQMARRVPLIAGADETFFERLILVMMDLGSGYLVLEEAAEDRTYGTWQERTQAAITKLGLELRFVVSDRAKALIKLALAPGASHDVRQVIASAGHLLFASNQSPCSPSTAAQAGQLVFHEVLADPPSGTAGDANRYGKRRARDEEFVEIVNAGGTPLCLSGWTLEDAEGHDGHLFPLGRALAPEQAVIVFGGGVPTGGFGGAEAQRATSAKGLDLDGAGDVLTLRGAVGAVARRLSWGDCASKPCASDHWLGGLRLKGSLVRCPAPDGGWRMHRDVAGSAFSAGLPNSGQVW